MRAAQLVVLAIFFLNGFALAGWFVRIPAGQERLGMGEGPLGVALLGAAVGALLSMPVAGALVSRLGSWRSPSSASPARARASPSSSRPL